MPEAPPRLLALVRREAAAAARLALLLGLVGALGPFCLILLKIQVYSLVIPTGSVDTAIGLACGFAIAAALVVGLDQCREVALLVIGNRVARRLAVPAVLAAAGRAGEPSVAAGEALRDVEEVRRGITGVLCRAVLDMVMLPALLALLWSFHWSFALFGLALCLPATLLGLVSERLTRTSLAEANRAEARTVALTADAMRCAEAVQAMGLMPNLLRDWAGNLARGAQQLRTAQGQARLVASASGALMGLARGGALVVAAVVGFEGINVGYGMIGGMLLTTKLIEPFTRLGAMLQEAGTARAAWQRLGETLAGRDAEPAGQAFPCPEGRLNVERLTILHPRTTRPLLHEASLSVGPGEVVALTGPPGCGKSSLLRAMLGMQRAVAGGVFLDGHATQQWDRADLARHIGYLPQDTTLGEGSVAEAIARLGPPDMGEVLRAARLAGAERCIAGLPQGFATPVGGQVKLSAGQRQRIALARAVYGGPRLVLLDEPTAWLDAEGEAAVGRMIGSLAREGRGVVFTTHRPPLLRLAQRVVTVPGPRALPAAAAPKALAAA